MESRYGGNLSSWPKVVREGGGRAGAESKSADPEPDPQRPGDILAERAMGDHTLRAELCPGLSSALSADREGLKLLLRTETDLPRWMLQPDPGLRSWQEQEGLSITMSGSQDLALCSSVCATER